MLRLIMLAASPFLINIRVGGAVLHASEPDHAASHTFFLGGVKTSLSFCHFFSSFFA